MSVPVISRTVGRLDAWQQRHRGPGFTLAVVKKFGDDGAGNLVALLTYYAFLATFPLLLALSAILGIVLKGDPSLQAHIRHSALAEFPIIGAQLQSQVGVASLGHSGVSLIIGILGAILGGRGLANAVQYSFNTVWNVAKADRPGFPGSALRTLGLLGLLGVGAVATAAGASLAAASHVLGVGGLPLRVVGFAVSTVIDMGLFLAAFRLATARSIRSADLVVGAVLSGLAWQALLSVAGAVVSRDLKHAQAVAGLFGVVLGLLAWFGLQATVTLYAVEADVVRTRHLWPRSLLAPPSIAGPQALTQGAEVEPGRRQRMTAKR